MSSTVEAAPTPEAALPESAASAATATPLPDPNPPIAVPLLITDATEVSLGISTYMSPHVSGFSAISKARFSDFMVHEVSLDGIVAKLTCMEPKVVGVDVAATVAAATPTATTTTDALLDEDKDSKDNAGDETMNEATVTNGGGDGEDEEEDNDNEDERKRKRSNDEESQEGVISSSAAAKKKKPTLDDSTGTTTAAAMMTDEKPDWSTIQQELEDILLTSKASSSAEEQAAATALSQRVVLFLQTTTDTLATATTADLKQMIKTEDPEDKLYVSIPVSSDNSSNSKDTNVQNNKASDEKEFRRKLHQWIRSRLDFCARGDTADVDVVYGNDNDDNDKKEKQVKKVIRIWHKAFERQMPTWKTFDKYNRDNNNNNNGRNSSYNRKLDNIHKLPYLRFVLYKENMDTGAALFQLQRRFADASGGGGRGGRGGRGGGRGGRGGRNNKFQPQQPLRIGHAGMKDKRGVTAQFITVPTRQTNMHALTRMCNYNNRNNNNYHGGGGAAGQALLRVGNFEFVPEELRLGRLQGNHFDIVLRNVQVPSKNIDAATSTSSSLSTNASSSTCCQEMLQKAVNALKQHGFINYFGLQRFGKHHDTHLTGIAVVKRDYATAIDIILRPKPGMEEQESVTRARIQWQERFHNINNNKLDATTTTTTTSGNSSDDKDDKDKAARRATAEQECAKSIVNCFNRSFQSSEVTVLHSLIQHPCDYERAFMCLNKTMRMMFLHALQSFLWNHVASLRIQQGYNHNNNNSKGRNGDDDDDEQCCHEVLVGDLVLLDSTAEATTSETATTETSSETPPSVSSSSSNPNRKDSSFRIPAVHVVTPEDVAARRFKLHDVVIPLMGSKTIEPRIDSITALFSKLLDEMGLTREALVSAGNNRDLHCTGDYRKLLCMPADVDFQLLEYSEPLQPLVPTDMMRLQGIQVKLPNTTTAAESKSSSSLLAMRVGFTLPSSAYATMALRELMKRPTSAAYQGRLDLGNNSNSKNNGNQREEKIGEQNASVMTSS